MGRVRRNGMDLIRAEPGGLARLADGLGLSRGAVTRWREVPAERVVAIERISGIPREILRPDLYRRSCARRVAAE